MPTTAHWSKAVDQLWNEGVRLTTIRASGKHAVDYYDLVSERAHKIMRPKPLPLPPVKRVLPMPPRPLPMSGAAT